jgi:hypothetical protein
VNVEHLIAEKTTDTGIDPSGRIIHRALIYTERVAVTAEIRHEPYAAS